MIRSTTPEAFMRPAFNGVLGGEFNRPPQTDNEYEVRPNPVTLAGLAILACEKTPTFEGGVWTWHAPLQNPPGAYVDVVSSPSGADVSMVPVGRVVFGVGDRTLSVVDVPNPNAGGVGAVEVLVDDAPVYRPFPLGAHSLGAMEAIGFVAATADELIAGRAPANPQ